MPSADSFFHRNAFGRNKGTSLELSKALLKAFSRRDSPTGTPSELWKNVGIMEKCLPAVAGEGGE